MTYEEFDVNGGRVLYRSENYAGSLSVLNTLLRSNKELENLKYLSQQEDRIL